MNPLLQELKKSSIGQFTLGLFAKVHRALCDRRLSSYELPWSRSRSRMQDSLFTHLACMMLSSVAVEASNCAKLIQTYKENISGESQTEIRALHKESEYRETWLQICFDMWRLINIMMKLTTHYTFERSYANRRT